MSEVLWIPYKKGDFKRSGVVSEGYRFFEDVISGMDFGEAKFMQVETWIVLHLTVATTPLFTKKRTIILAANVWNCDYFVKILRPSDPIYNEARKAGDFVYDKTWDEMPKDKKDKEISDYFINNNFLRFHLD